MPQQSDDGPARFKSRSRTALLTNRTRLPWRRRASRRMVYKKTAAEKKAAAEKRRLHRTTYREALHEASRAVTSQAVEMNAKFGAHSIDYYEKEIMQRSRLTAGKRSVNRWNVYLRNQTRVINDALGPDVPRSKASDLANRIAATWKTMSQEEKLQATNDGVSELEGHREMKALATRTVPIDAFHDARQTLQGIETEVHALHARTGLEVALFAARGKTSDFIRPFVVATSKRSEDFFRLAYGQALEDVGIKMEAYCLSGTQGVADSYMRNIISLKSQLSVLIIERLREAAGVRIPRMYYESFDTHITAQYGVVCEKWPLDKFTSPASITTRNEVELLLQAWKTRTTYFRRLSTSDWEQWKEARFQGLLSMQMHERGEAGHSGEGYEGVDEDVHVNMIPGPSFLSQPSPSSQIPSPSFLSQPSPSSQIPSPSFLSQSPSSQISSPSFLSQSSSSQIPSSSFPFFQPALPHSLASVDGGASSQMLGGPSNDSRPSKKKKTSVGAVGSADGTPMPPTKQRKKRSDAGVKRGPRTKT